MGVKVFWQEPQFLGSNDGLALISNALPRICLACQCVAHAYRLQDIIPQGESAGCHLFSVWEKMKQRVNSLENSRLGNNP
jgi:hypothetical protein